MKNLLTIVAILIFFVSKGQKTVYLPIGVDKDTTLWYKWQRANCLNAAMPDLLNSKDSLHFRFSTDIQAVDVWTNDFTHFFASYSIFTTCPGQKSEGLGKKEAFYGGTWPLKTDVAKTLFSLFQSFHVDIIKPQDSIKDWRNGFDGDEFIIEYSTPRNYSFKTYWTPSIYKEKIPEACLIDSFATIVQRQANFSARFGTFVRSLPKGCYRAGSYFVMCTNIKVKKRKKGT